MSKENHATRARLVAEGLKSMLINGYDGIGLNAILDAAGVPKGSFYYFFRSKEAFATAVLDAYESHYFETRSALFSDHSISPLQRLKQYFDEAERMHLAEAPLGGCLYGVFGQTASARSAAFRRRLAAVFNRWEHQIQQLLEEAQAAGEIDPTLDPQEAAAFLIEAYEGVLIRIKVEGNPAAFERFKRFAFAALEVRQQRPCSRITPGPAENT